MFKVFGQDGRGGEYRQGFRAFEERDGGDREPRARALARV